MERQILSIKISAKCFNRLTIIISKKETYLTYIQVNSSIIKQLNIINVPPWTIREATAFLIYKPNKKKKKIKDKNNRKRKKL